jgi:hypothetical protein
MREMRTAAGSLDILLWAALSQVTFAANRRADRRTPDL